MQPAPAVPLSISHHRPEGCILTIRRWKGIEVPHLYAMQPYFPVVSGVVAGAAALAFLYLMFYLRDRPRIEDSHTFIGFLVIVFFFAAVLYGQSPLLTGGVCLYMVALLWFMRAKRMSVLVVSALAIGGAYASTAYLQQYLRNLVFEADAKKRNEEYETYRAESRRRLGLEIMINHGAPEFASALPSPRIAPHAATDTIIIEDEPEIVIPLPSGLAYSPFANDAPETPQRRYFLARDGKDPEFFLSLARSPGASDSGQLDRTGVIRHLYKTFAERTKKNYVDTDRDTGFEGVENAALHASDAYLAMLCLVKTKNGASDAMGFGAVWIGNECFVLTLEAPGPADAATQGLLRDWLAAFLAINTPSPEIATHPRRQSRL